MRGVRGSIVCVIWIGARNDGGDKRGPRLTREERGKSGGARFSFWREMARVERAGADDCG